MRPSGAATFFVRFHSGGTDGGSTGPLHSNPELRQRTILDLPHALTAEPEMVPYSLQGHHRLNDGRAQASGRGARREEGGVDS